MKNKKHSKNNNNKENNKTGKEISKQLKKRGSLRNLQVAQTLIEVSVGGDIPILWIFPKGSMQLFKCGSVSSLHGPARQHQLVDCLRAAVSWPVQPVILVLYQIQNLFLIQEERNFL